tara:strand:+ start:537 stop:989 length:453 start_codon:yes stop_codon:yes gene_type:complete
VSDGWGQLTWGQGLWGEQNDALIPVSGLATASSLGAVDAVSVIHVIGSIAPSAIASSQGSITTTGTAVITQTGLSGALSLGPWGFSNDTYETVSGLPLASSLGSVTSYVDVNIAQTGFSLTSSLGSINLVNWQEVSVGTSVTWTEVDRAA